jgi:hypothetical protein
MPSFEGEPTPEQRQQNAAELFKSLIAVASDHDQKIQKLFELLPEIRDAMLARAEEAVDAAFGATREDVASDAEKRIGEASARISVALNQRIDEQVKAMRGLKKQGDTELAAMRATVEQARPLLAQLADKLAAEAVALSDTQRAEVERIVSSERVKFAESVSGIQLQLRGAYGYGVVYRVGDIVSWRGSSYVASVNGELGEPKFDSKEWQILAMRGVAGADGPRGGDATAAITAHNTDPAAHAALFAEKANLDENGRLEPSELPEEIDARIQVLSGTDAALATEVLALGELAAPTDGAWIRKGDGVTAGGVVVGRPSATVGGSFVPNQEADLGGNTGLSQGGTGTPGTGTPLASFIRFRAGNGGSNNPTGSGNGGGGGATPVSSRALVLIRSGDGGNGGTVSNGGNGGTLFSSGVAGYQAAIVFAGGKGGDGGSASLCNGGAGGNARSSIFGPLLDIRGGNGGNGGTETNSYGGPGGLSGALQMRGGAGGSGSSTSGAKGGDAGTITMNGGAGSANDGHGGFAGVINTSGGAANSSLPGLDGGAGGDIDTRGQVASTISRGISGGKINLSGANGGASVLSGVDSPEGVVTASQGSVYLRTAGDATTALYIKTSGGPVYYNGKTGTSTGGTNTGWAILNSYRVSVPANSAAAGSAGQWASDDNFLYFYGATGWRRIAGAIF